MKILTKRRNRFFSKEVLLVLLVVIGVAPLSSAQGIFDDLPYSEEEIRGLLSRHTLQLSSIENSDSIPEHIFYQQIFVDLLSDTNRLNQLPVDDAAIILALPSHQDASFVEKDQSELSAVCEIVATVGDKGPLVGAAEAFDRSRQRREQELDIHYETVLSRLSMPTQQLVRNELAEMRNQRHITYAIFSLGALAAESPGLASAIVRSGCESFADTVFELQSITLFDQLRNQHSLNPYVNLPQNRDIRF